MWEGEWGVGGNGSSKLVGLMEELRGHTGKKRSRRAGDSQAGATQSGGGWAGGPGGGWDGGDRLFMLTGLMVRGLLIMPLPWLALAEGHDSHAASDMLPSPTNCPSLVATGRRS